jgi:hypothetical protein
MFSLVGSNYSHKDKNMVQHFKSNKMTCEKMENQIKYLYLYLYLENYYICET